MQAPSQDARGGSPPALLPVTGSLGLVGFDASDVVRGAFHKGVHQVVGLFLFGVGGKKGNS